MGRLANAALTAVGVWAIILLAYLAFRLPRRPDGRSSQRDMLPSTLSLSYSDVVNQSRGRLHTLPRRSRPRHGIQPFLHIGLHSPILPASSHTSGTDSELRQSGALPLLPASLLVLISAYGNSSWLHRRAQLLSLVHMCRAGALLVRVVYMSTIGEELFMSMLLEGRPRVADCGPKDPLPLRVITFPASLGKSMTRKGLQQVIASKEFSADAELMVLYLEDDVRFTLRNLQAYMSSLRLIQAAGLLRPGGFIPQFVRCETRVRNVAFLEDPEYSIPLDDCIPIDYRFSWGRTRGGILASVKLDSSHPDRFYVPSNAHAAVWMAPAWLLTEVLTARLKYEAREGWPQVWAATGWLLGDPGGHYRWKRMTNNSMVLTPVVPCNAANMTVAHLSQKYGGNVNRGLIVDSLQAYIQAGCAIMPRAKPKATQCKESNLQHVMDYLVPNSRISPLNLVSRAIEPTCRKASDHPFCDSRFPASSSAVDILDEYDFVGFTMVCEHWEHSDDLPGLMLWSECAANCSAVASSCTAFSFVHGPVHQGRSRIGKCRLWGRLDCGSKYIQSRPYYGAFPVVFLYRKRRGGGPAINSSAAREEFSFARSQTVCDF
mmetsp:Transcript_10156/g.26983  ORF Transcript_10156/g.26983 Transcript_10156/m.26983 type:complete len:602 (+) Transcript_10156:57-1862(+)